MVLSGPQFSASCTSVALGFRLSGFHSASSAHTYAFSISSLRIKRVYLAVQN